MGQSKTSEWKLPAIGFAVFALLAIGVFAWVNSSQTLGNEHHAESACKEFVKEKLTSPASADFSDVTVSKTGEGEWTVEGTVDADNSFGAAMRGGFTCDVWTSDGDTYEGQARLSE